jgi:preprotein translocase subunit SecG
MLQVLTYLLIFVEVVVSFLLIGVILLQKTKGQGVGLTFGAAMGESLFGARVGNVLTRTTVVLGVIFLINTTALAFLGGGRRVRSVADSIKVSPQQPPPLTAAPTPESAVDMPASLPDEPVATFPVDMTAEPAADVVPAPALDAAPAPGGEAVPAPTPDIVEPAPKPDEPEPGQ